MKTLTFARRKPLDKIIKAINSQAINTSPGNYDLKAVFYKHFSNELAPALLDAGESLAPKVLLLEQESYLLHIKKVIKEILETIHPLHF